VEKLGKYATEFIFYMPLVATGSEDYQDTPTIAAGDFQVSTDGSAFTNLDTIPVVTPAATEQVKVTLSIAEMTGKQINIKIIDPATKEWQPDWITVATYGHASSQHPNVGETMRGTDSAALASVCTEARLAELDGANLPTDISLAALETTAQSILTESQSHPTLAEIEATTVLAKEATLADATYGLSALKTLLDAIDTSNLTDTYIGYK